MVADPHHFNAIRIHIFTSVRIRIQLLICDTSIQTLQGSILSVHIYIVSLFGHPRLHIEPIKFHSADPDPAFTLMRIRIQLLKIMLIRSRSRAFLYMDTDKNKEIQF